MTSCSWRPGKRVAIVGGGPGGISTALAFLNRGFDVQVFEKQSVPRGIGGAVLLCVPVLAILRSYGLDPADFGTYTKTTFKNSNGAERVQVPWNPKIEKAMGIKGWHYGVLRASAFQKMLDIVPEGVVQGGHEFHSYVESQDGVEIEFKNGNKITADIIIGADGIRSGVSRQALGDPQLFHAGVRVYLAWCDPIPDIPPHYGVISHNWQYQASFFPMTHNGKPGYEWWIVEPSWEGKPVPEDLKSYLTGITTKFADPIPRFPVVTNFETQVFRWEIYNRPSLKKWSNGRAVCVGDAVHPVSPYAAYGMGMAIEDGYYLARALDGVDLRNLHAVEAGFEIYERDRVDYANHNTEFARFLGRVFHSLPWPLAWLRDLFFDYTPFLKHYISKNYFEKSELETFRLKELHVNN
ncbi:unnamed protein product [Clonostachys rosea]|uniref:FAD-binding domain-containing protein n=1 Tax=Bionectria ochroleuca TaxID=29856 RepID=A0ABY6UUX0_BIOOC|nr:unnamed protein product [Clonostachys rosea]